jgi:hypothetical protein
MPSRFSSLIAGRQEFPEGDAASAFPKLADAGAGFVDLLLTLDD